jgi:hypothetical protein
MQIVQEIKKLDFPEPFTKEFQPIARLLNIKYPDEIRQTMSDKDIYQRQLLAGKYFGELSTIYTALSKHLVDFAIKCYIGKLFTQYESIISSSLTN